MKKILTLQDIKSSSWGERIHDLLGNNLLSAFLHGNCLHEGFDAIHEPWQISLILEDSRPEKLRDVHRLSRDMAKDNLKFGFFLDREFLLSKQNDYPLEFLHISQKNVLLYGNPPLSGFVPEEMGLRNECRWELECRRLHLIREFTRIQAGITPMDFFIAVYEEILPILYGVFFLKQKKYPQNREELLECFPEFRIKEPALTFDEDVKRADAILAAIRQLEESL